jgi:choline dehydrogenase-like flavoprotein
VRFDSVAHVVASRFAPRVVIIGSGPAGQALALRLQQYRVPCLVVEAGGLEPSAASQAQYRARVLGDPYHALDRARLRQFGGTSGHWTGWCRPLDPIDFDARPEIGRPGWPITPADLEPQAEATRAILQIAPIDANRPLSAGLDEVTIRFSPPVRFGQAYRREIEQSASIGLLVDTALTDVVPVAGRVDEIELSGRDGTRTRLKVDQLCLCTGGIENSRLLLWFNRRHRGGVVPQAATLGRYWMDHLLYNVADTLFYGDAAARFDDKRFFATSAAAARAQAVGEARMWIEPVVRSGAKLKELLRDAACVAPSLFERLYRATDRELLCGAPLRMEWEQLPESSNRIELDSDTDALGMPRPVLHWRRSPMERKAAIVGARMFGEWLIERNLGRLRIRRWLLDDAPWSEREGYASRHHMGGTRMAASPTDGVVDRDCRVFGVDNLFIGGSSVFPAGGHANPTYTIVQLALRLGDHLAGKLGTVSATPSATAADRARGESAAPTQPPRPQS